MLKHLFFSSALMLSAPLVMAQGTGGPPYIAVHGSANVSVVPDIFPLVVTLVETSKDTAGTQARIEGLATSVLAVAREQSVTDADLKVGSLSIEPAMEYDEATRKRIFLGNEYKRVI